MNCERIRNHDLVLQFFIILNNFRFRLLDLKIHQQIQTNKIYSVTLINMKGSSKLSYKQIKAALQKEKQQKLKVKAQNKTQSPLIKCCYLFTKLFICFLIVSTILVTLLILLGSNGVHEQQKIFQLLQKDNKLSKNKDQLKVLLKQQKQTSYRNLINIYLPISDNDQEEENQNQLKDLSLIARFALRSIDPESKIATLPMHFQCVQSCGLVSQQITTKALNAFKQLLKKILNYFNLKQSSKKKDSQDQSVLETLKQLIVKGKHNKIKQLLINQLWDFVNDHQNYILYWNNDSKQIQNKKQILKSLKKWIKQHESSIIFIVSKTSICKSVGSDSFKSYELDSDFKNIDLKFLQDYLPFWDKSQVQIIKKKVASFDQLNVFLAFINNNKGRFDALLNKQQRQIVDNVCQHNHHKFQFYNGQKSVHKLMKRSKIQSESRWERQLQALKIKMSHLKNWVGISFIQDVYRTFTSNSKVSLSRINQKGIQYHFDDHQFNWKQSLDKLWYQVQNKNFCGQIPAQIQTENQQEQNQESPKDKVSEDTNVNLDKQDQKDQTKQQEKQQEGGRSDNAQQIEKTIENQEQPKSSQQSQEITVLKQRQENQSNKQFQQTEQVNEQGKNDLQLDEQKSQAQTGKKLQEIAQQDQVLKKSIQQPKLIQQSQVNTGAQNELSIEDTPQFDQPQTTVENIDSDNKSPQSNDGAFQQKIQDQKSGKSQGQKLDQLQVQKSEISQGQKLNQQHQNVGHQQKNDEQNTDLDKKADQPTTSQNEQQVRS